MKKLRILLADDHVTVREGVKMIINAQADMEVVAEAADGRGAVAEAQAVRPDVVVMDVSMPRVNGLKATEMLTECCPEVKVLALTRHQDDGYLQQLLRAGAAGYVLKQSRPAELLQAIRAIGGGGSYLDPAVAGRVIGDYGRRRQPVTDRRGRRHTEQPRRGGPASHRMGLQQQGDRDASRPEREDGGDAQSECDAQAADAQPHRHRAVRAAARLARGQIVRRTGADRQSGEFKTDVDMPSDGRAMG